MYFGREISGIRKEFISPTFDSITAHHSLSSWLSCCLQILPSGTQHVPGKRVPLLCSCFSVFCSASKATWEIHVGGGKTYPSCSRISLGRGMVGGEEREQQRWIWAWLYYSRDSTLTMLVSLCCGSWLCKPSSLMHSINLKRHLHLACSVYFL